MGNKLPILRTDAHFFSGIGINGVKIIMTTAKSQSEDIFGSFNDGCEAYLVKPVRKDDLFAEINKLGLMTKSS